MAEAAARGLRTNFRFSPGFGDLPLAVQPAFLAALDAPRRIGLAATAGNLLVPTKSVTAVVGLFEGEPSSASARSTCASLRAGRTLRAQKTREGPLPWMRTCPLPAAVPCPGRARRPHRSTAPAGLPDPLAGLRIADAHPRARAARAGLPRAGRRHGHAPAGARPHGARRAARPAELQRPGRHRGHPRRLCARRSRDDHHEHVRRQRAQAGGPRDGGRRLPRGGGQRPRGRRPLRGGRSRPHRACCWSPWARCRSRRPTRCSPSRCAPWSTPGATSCSSRP